MEKVKINFRNVSEQLSREEMREIMAGSGDCGYFNCQCYNMPGAWTGYYCSASQVYNAVSTYCAQAGYCS